MKRSTIGILLLWVITTTGLTLAGEEPKMEPTEWTKVEVQGADQTNVTRVLFIGDSILGGYFWDVTSRLGGEVKCASMETSASIANPDFMAQLAIVLKRFDFSVIHMNNGLHGMSYNEEEYAAALSTCIAAIRKLQPEARIVWAYTTPVRNGDGFQTLDEGHAARVRERNRIAAELMKKYGYTTNDLYSTVIDHPEYYSDGTHYNDAGRKAEADQVEQVIRDQLQNIKTRATP